MSWTFESVLRRNIKNYFIFFSLFIFKRITHNLKWIKIRKLNKVKVFWEIGYSGSYFEKYSYEHFTEIIKVFCIFFKIQVWNFGWNYNIKISYYPLWKIKKIK